jgi:NCAIR mutase (PurE)-related protein
MTIHTNIDKNIAQSVTNTYEKMRSNEQGKSMIYRNSKYRKTSKLSLANIAIGKDL